MNSLRGQGYTACGKSPSSGGRSPSSDINQCAINGASASEEPILLLEEFFHLPVFEGFHDSSHILRTFARANKQRIRGFDDHQAAYANRGHIFSGTPEKIAFRVQRLSRPCENILIGVLRE